MKTQITPIGQLQPGDKVYVQWPADRKKPEWWKLPDELTVKAVNITKGTVDVKETGGLCLQAPELYKVIYIEPSPGDTITFILETWNDLGLKEDKEVTAVVERTDFDPLKRREPKCIVWVDGKNYGIPFSEIKSLQKKQSQQLTMF